MTGSLELSRRCGVHRKSRLSQSPVVKRRLSQLIEKQLSDPAVAWVKRWRGELKRGAVTTGTKQNHEPKSLKLSYGATRKRLAAGAGVEDKCFPQHVGMIIMSTQA